MVLDVCKRLRRFTARQVADEFPDITYSNVRSQVAFLCEDGLVRFTGKKERTGTTHANVYTTEHLTGTVRPRIPNSVFALPLVMGLSIPDETLTGENHEHRN